ncbi:hypothetical protein [Tenacibaculum haliotis]|uniref:hypothetical protein n=1 Tax=Tenacibaculum haliotis TaxID=1888914 RepID=UPI0021B014CC|nr:hypothetical protein [Tenacibaculum haliotis]MCT4698404.1 hypothetical protein [Tenacibaculum haliotis]
MNKLIIIKGGQKHFIFRIIAAILYAFALYILAQFFINTSISTVENYTISFLHVLKFEVYLITLALLASVVSNHHFNLKDKTYRKYYSVGPLGYGKWQNISRLTYASIYLNNNDIYEVIIWDENNDRFKISFHKLEKDAVETAKYVADKLSIDYYTK